MDTLNLFVEEAWKVVVWSLVLGAGLVAVFALGVRALTPQADRTDASGPDARVALSPVRVIAASVCFLIVVTGVALGLTYIVASGQGKVLSFENGAPTLVPAP